ncbi:Pyridoxamine 5'-phosphate oxidase family protein [Hirschfeldia incana]|nr:Pyridoxamine 5'-phosphate oxidase family protein [Hirschfeldia incana]
MEATVFTSLHVSNLPKPKAIFNLNPPALTSSSKLIIKLRLNGSIHGVLRLNALFHNEEAPSEKGDDNLAKNNEFGLLPADMFSLSQEKVGSSLSGDKDSHKIIDVETSLALPAHSGGSRAGLFRTPISGGVQNATSAHGLPPPALAVRNLMEQARLAHLCTVMSKMHHRREGYPFGSLVDFAPDPMGHPIFSFSPLAIHTRNILAEPRSSLVVQIPGWSCLSNARATLFGDVYPLPKDEQEWAHKQYMSKHHQGPSQRWGNFHYFRMHNISDIYFIGGFGTVAWINVNEYEEIQPDKIAVDGGEQNLKELNAIFSKPLRELLSTESEVDDAAIISVDSKGIDIRVRQGAQFNVQRLSFEGSLGVETLEEAKSAMWKVIEKGKVHYL